MQSFPLSLLWQKSTKEVEERSKKYQNIRTLVPHPPFCTTPLPPPLVGKKLMKGCSTKVSHAKPQIKMSAISFG